MEKLVLDGIASRTQSLLDHWCEIRSGKMVPARTELRPAAIQKLLPSLTLLEYTDPCALIYRLVGTEIVNRLGFDFTGLNLFDLVAADRRPDALHCFNAIRIQPCGLLLRIVLHSKYGAKFMAELLHLPLLGRDGQISQLVTVATVLERHERDASSKFNHDAVEPVAALFVDIGAGFPSEQTVSRGPQYKTVIFR